MVDSTTASAPDATPDADPGKGVAKRAAPPPAPVVPTSVAVAPLICGNIVLALLLFVLVRDLAPNWVVLVGIVIAALAATVVNGSSLIKLSERFVSARTAEVRPFVRDEATASARAAEDLRTSVNLDPMRPGIAIPILVATFVVPVEAFVDVDRAQADLYWMLRWLLAAVVAAVYWLPFLALWWTANSTPAIVDIDLAALRGETADVQLLGPEDQNDVRIISEISSLESLHRKIDTYTLEGALLSALSFSSFLSIVLSEEDYGAQLESIFSPERDLIAFARIDVPLVGPVDHLAYPSMQYFDGHLVAWIAISLLLCAATFLGVLVARLRFNDGYRDAESALKAAERLNERQDLAIERDQTAKVPIYSREIEEFVHRAGELQAGLNYTVMHMRWSRNAGIFCFVVTLILCGFFFNLWIAGLIAAIYAVSWMFGSIDRQERGKLRRRIFGRGGLVGLLTPLRGARRR